MPTNKSIDTQTLTRRLVEELGPTIVALVAESRDREAPLRWANGSEEVPEDSIERLVFLNKIFTQIATDESADIARAWLLGCNPGLGEEQPIFAIRNERFNDVDAASHRFTRGLPASA